MGNCTGCEDQQNIEARNEILYDKSRRPCKENNKLLKNPRRAQNINKENQLPPFFNSSPKKKEVSKLEATFRVQEEEPKREEFRAIKDEGRKEEGGKEEGRKEEKKREEWKIEQGRKEEGNREEGRREEGRKEESRKEEGRKEEDVNIPRGLVKLERMPDYLNENTRIVVEKLGEFQYDDEDEDLLKEFGDLPFYGPVEVDENAVYFGQWKDGKRQGKGKQVWSDGSQYEGYWYNDMANIRGRLIHVDGDVFEGDWVDDKAHGKGNLLFSFFLYYFLPLIPDHFIPFYFAFLLFFLYFFLFFK